eukprot:NODE_1227_length_1019_cov_516.025773_g941_i0.p1 GENE.NODE_1227_length_1019_cov_516.025773_g941_i0~~NODE_1227_length_1019_cov_516.025773_g941_i0.p1  ORF type:complete len:182 (-),score=42.00 NODE_1227_length_1019_cov_516.025773_g941_i0:96-641(-)
MGDTISGDVYTLKAEQKCTSYAAVAQLKHEKEALSVDASLVVDTKVLGNVGCQVTSDLVNLSSVQFGANRNLTDRLFASATLANFAELKAGVVYKKSPTWTLAAEYQAKCISNMANATITAGCEGKLESGQIFKAKLDNQGVIGGSLTHKIAPELKLINTMEVRSGSNWASKFGTQFLYEA